MLRVRTLHKHVLSVIFTAIVLVLAMTISAAAAEAPPENPVISYDQSLSLQNDGYLYYGSYKLNGNGTFEGFPDVSVFGGSYSFAGGTLNLNGVNFSTSAAIALDLTGYSSPLTLNISGSNSFVSTFSGNDSTVGIHANGMLTITGSGTLTATSGTSDGDISYGISTNTTITGGTVTITGNDLAVYGSLTLPAAYTWSADGASGTCPDTAFTYNDQKTVSITTATGATPATYTFNKALSNGVFHIDYSLASGVTFNNIVKNGTTALSSATEWWSVDDNTIEITSSYLMGLDVGTYTITLDTTAATDPTVALTVTNVYEWGLYLNASGELICYEDTITQGTPSTILGGGSYSFADGILTLNNVNFTTSDATALELVVYSAPVTLNINGSNSFVSTYNGTGNNSHCIDIEQPLTITGDGSLTVLAGNTTKKRSVGIWSNEDITISGTVNVTAAGGTARDNSRGIQSSGGDINIFGGDMTLSGYTSAANTGSITPAIAAVDAANADGRAAVRFDNTPIDLAAIKYIKTYKTEADYLRDYPPAPEPEPQPEPKPSRPSRNPSPAPKPQTYEPGDTQEYKTKSGITAKVTVTENGVEVEAGLNKSGSVNSEATAAAVKKAAEIAYANGYKSITIEIPEGATGLSKSTVQKLVNAANGLELVLALTSMIDGEEVGSISLPINSKTGQILTGLYFETKNIQNVQNYIAKKWKTDILGSFETAQKGGWGDTATLSVSMDKLGFSAEDGTSLYAIIYDTKTGIMYQVPAVVEGGNVVVETKRTGVVTIVTERVK